MSLAEEMGVKDIIHSDPVVKSKSHVNSSMGTVRFGSGFTNFPYFGRMT